MVCKTGYSNIAECCQAGARVISVGRADFAESAPILKTTWQGFSITPEMYQNGSWITLASDLLPHAKPAALLENGADKVADFLCMFI